MKVYKQVSKKEREDRRKHRAGEMGKSLCGFVGGHEEKSSAGLEEEKGEIQETVQEITREELVRQLKKLKDRKVPGEDGIENEA